MACKCENWCRIDGRRTNHHPNCKEFKEEKFARISLIGFSPYLLPLKQIGTFIDEIREAEVEGKWEVTLVKMTQEEYEALPEFQGH